MGLRRRARPGAGSCEVAESVADPTCLLDQEVDGVSGPVRRSIGMVVGEISVSQAEMVVAKVTSSGTWSWSATWV